MAREYARVLVTRWDDGESWRELNTDAQWLYDLLISLPGMSSCGVHTYAPRRWAKKGLRGRGANQREWTVKEIEAAVKDLEAGRFVIVDRDTDELLIRGHIRHDRALRTANVAKAVVKTWRQISSPTLRGVVLQEIERVFAEPKQTRWPGLECPELLELVNYADAA